MLDRFFKRGSRLHYTDEEARTTPIPSIDIRRLTQGQAQSLFDTIRNSGACVLGGRKMKQLETRAGIVEGELLEFSEIVRQVPRLPGG